MKFTSILSIALVAGMFALGSPSFAAKGGNGKPPKGGKNNRNDKGDDAAARFDKNHNGRIDPDEAADIQAAFDKNKDGPLKKYDTNHNGNLEKSEIASIHVAARPGK